MKGGKRAVIFRYRNPKTKIRRLEKSFIGFRFDVEEDHII